MKLIDKFLKNAVCFPMSTQDDKVVFFIKGINPKNLELVELTIETDKIRNSAMFNATIESTLEEHLGIKYDYTTDIDQEQKLNDEMEKFLSLPQ